MNEPNMLRLPIDIARCTAENIQAFATYREDVAEKSQTEHGKQAALDGAKALRAYAGGLLEHAT